MLLGEKIRNERKLANISQEELSEQIGVSLKTVQRWESCERSPRVEQIMQISKVLGLRPEYLLRGLKEGEDMKILPNEKLDDQKSILVFRNGDKEVKLPDTEPNRELFLQVVREILTHGSAVPAIDSSIKVNAGRDNVYHGMEVATA